MSGTTTTTTTPTADTLWTPQTIIALFGMVMVTGTIIGVFLKADAPTLQLVVGLVIGTYGGSVFSFYFGSSKSSQTKDAALQQIATGNPPPAVVTVTPVAPPPTPPPTGHTP